MPRVSLDELDDHLTLEGFSSEEQQQFKSMLKDMELEYAQVRLELLYTSEHAQFRLVPSEPVAGHLGHIVASVQAGKEKVYYHNTKTLERIMQVLQDSQLVKVELPYEAYDWVITEEEYFIGQFACKKAIAKVDYYDDAIGNEIQYEIEAWFAPEIPLPYGPAGIDGLPGLVLQTHVTDKPWMSYTVVYLEEGLSLKDQKSIKLEAGKTISKAEYDEYNKKLYLSRQ
jgi:GLPGLI family protein